MAPKAIQKERIRDGSPARYLVGAINLLAQGEQSGKFTDHVFSPGAYRPTDTSCLFSTDTLPITQLPQTPDQDEDDLDDFEDDVGEETVPEIAHTNLPAQTEVRIDLAPDDINDSFTADDLLAFARALDVQPLDSGIDDISLRRAVRELHSPTILITAMCGDDLQTARSFLLSDRATKLNLLKVMRDRIKDDGKQTTLAGQDANIAIIERVKSRMDQILNASTQRLDSELFELGTQAQAWNDQLKTELDRFEAYREQIIRQVHSIVGALAVVTRAWEERKQYEGIQAEFNGMIGASESHKAALFAAQAQAGRINDTISRHEGDYLSKRQLAESVIGRLGELKTASLLLGVELPREMRSQIEQICGTLRVTVSTCAEQFMRFETPDIDSKLLEAFAQIEEQKRRMAHLLNPIRPSVFKRRLDRDEELRRLVLIAFHLLTPDKKSQPHEGRGKISACKIVTEADLADNGELDRLIELTVELKDASPKLLETNRVGRRWRYRPTQAGREQAVQWFDECLDQEEVAQAVELGRKTVNTQFRQRLTDRTET